MFDRSEYLSALDWPARPRETPVTPSRPTSMLRRCRRFLRRVGPARAVAFLFGVAAVLAIALFLFDKPEPTPSSIEDLGFSRRPAAESAAGADPADGDSSVRERPPVGVFVTGAVRVPGVYYFGEGKRFVDAVDAAGGALPEADLSRVNLAAPLEDGIRIYVPKAGEDLPPDVSGTGVSSGAGVPGGVGATGSGGGGAQMVNVNRAPASELERLPGIGPALAQRIVEDRSRNGPFRALQDLGRVPGIGDVKISQLAPFVTF